MARTKFTTTLDVDLLAKAKEKADTEKLDGVNVILEKALRLYFSNCSTEVWEKPLEAGWVKKLIVRPNRVSFESIRSRKVLTQFKPSQYTQEALEKRGWKQVWKVKQ